MIDTNASPSRAITHAASSSALDCITSAIARCHPAVVGSVGVGTSRSRKNISGLASVQNPYSTAAATTRTFGIFAAKTAAPGRISTGDRTSKNFPCGFSRITARGSIAISPCTYRTIAGNVRALSGSIPKTPSLRNMENRCNCTRSIGAVTRRVGTNAP